MTQMHYGEPVIRRAVPLALGLISVSNPQLTILDTLSKYSHDNDLEVALCAIFAMGLVGAGTNNARLARLVLRRRRFGFAARAFGDFRFFGFVLALAMFFHRGWGFRPGLTIATIFTLSAWPMTLLIP